MSHTRRSSFLVSVGLAALLSMAQTNAALAATAPDLGVLLPYAIVSETYTNSINTALETAIIGNVCFTTGSATVPVSVIGTYGVGCPATALQVQNDALALLNSQPCTNLGAGAINLDTVSIGGGPNGTFPPGCYFNGGAMNIVTGATVTLNGPGVYVFRPGGALTTEANSHVALANGACASDVYWAPVGATTIGANAATSPSVATFVGNIFRGNAAGLSITLGHFAHLTGRALAFGSTVTTDSNTIDVPTCAPFTVITTLTTQASSDVTLGAAISDTATLSGGTSPTGTITFRLYGPNDATCSSAAIFTSLVTVSDNGTYPSGSFTPTTEGTYRWIANYGGDTNNAATANTCNALNETVAVTTAAAAIPTLSEWGVIIFMGLVGLVSMYYLRRKRREA